MSAEVLADLLAAAGRLEDADFGLDAAAVARLAPFARHADGGHRDDALGVDWAAWGRGLDDADLQRLIRLFTLAESAFGAWAAADASPVIPLAAELKRRGRYPADLTAWIRAHSSNRFLPYGNLMKRL
jgi:hypothetical protein